VTPGRGPALRVRACFGLALGTGFVAAVWAIRAVRLALLLDPDPAWAFERLLLGLLVMASAAAAASAAAGLLAVWSLTASFDATLEPLPFSRRALAALGLCALAGGALARRIGLSVAPWPMWVDDLSLLRPALALRGALSDFADSIRAAPFGVPHPFGTIGVAYLEMYRVSLHLWGTTVLGVRFPSFAAGALSVATAMALGRLLLPRGGGMLAGLALSGLRWSLILSRWGWQAIVLAPLLDAAAMLVLLARRRSSAAIAAAGGLVAGLSPHVYLSGWPGSAALLALSAWPSPALTPGRRARLGAVFAAGFLAAAAPLFLLREGRSTPYFVRVGNHNVFKEARYKKSWMTVFSAGADALASPWFAADPTPRHDIPGRSRLGWILGVPVAAITIRSFFRPREEISGFLLANAAAAWAGSVAAGEAGNPNGYRYGYLTTATAVAVAAGALWLLQSLPASRRRLGAVAATGLIAIASALGARDALGTWAESRETFDGFYGQDSMIGRAAARWDRYGSVSVDPRLGFAPRQHSFITIATVRDFALDSEERRRQRDFGDPLGRGRAFRLAPRA